MPDQTDPIEQAHTAPPRKWGYIKDKVDARDLHLSLPAPSARVPLPPSADLRWCLPPIYDQGDIGSCHDDTTEVLIEAGWKKFSALNGSERLASVNPIDGELIYEIPTRLIRLPYRGQMVCGSHRSLNFRVTPDHQMLVRKWNEKARTLNDFYEFVPAQDIGWYCGLLNRVHWSGVTQGTAFTLPGVDHKHKEQRVPRDIPMTAWLRFLGIYLAEGTMLKRDQRQGVVSYKIQIAASKEREKQFVREALVSIGVHALELDDRFTFSCKQVYEALASLGLEGVKAGNKFVPSFVFRQSSEMIAEFLSGHFAGDGSAQNEHRAHYTASVQLADDLQTLIFLSGQESSVSFREGRTSMTADGRVISGFFDEHRVSVCERKNLSIDRKADVTSEYYEGDVFCAEVPTYHTLVTRREGQILISGNCTAQAIAAAIDFERRRSGRPYLYPSRLFIYYNERKMEGTVGEDAGAELRDGIKSVAKLGVCPEFEWPYRSGGMWGVEPPKDCYDNARLYRTVRYSRVSQDPYYFRHCLGVLQRPIVFGFEVYPQFESTQIEKDGVLKFPAHGEVAIGGHAVLACGYDDLEEMVLVRNSWGAGWGLGGYFKMPYQYFLNSTLCSDFWVVLAEE